MLKNEDVRNFFNFLVYNKVDSDFTCYLEDYVTEAKRNVQWRFRYMTWERQRTYDFNDGRRAGVRDNALDSVQKLLLLKKLADEEICNCCGISLEELKKEVATTTV